MGAETEVEGGSRAFTEILQWRMATVALVQGGRQLRKEAEEGDNLEAEPGGGRQKEIAKGKEESKNVPWFQKESPWRPFAAMGNPRKKEARERGPRRLRDGGAAECPRGRVLGQPESAGEARIYESAAQMRQLLSKSSYHAVITSSWSPGLIRN